MLPKISPTKTIAWNKLKLLSQKPLQIKQLFFEDKMRFYKFSIENSNFLFDFSKNRINKDIFEELINLSKECQLDVAIEQFFAGKKINETENRAVMHTALRNFTKEKIEIDGINVMPKIKKVRQQMQNFSEAVISGKHLGYTGKKITDVVNLGIGGSDLGPKMICNALKSIKNHLNIHFVSNVDSQHLAETLLNLNSETTLFIVASKTFTTQETMANALSARDWFLKKASKKDVEKHFVALSTNIQAVEHFGILKENTFEFWDWVGGRYSLWSSIGLSICLAVGYKNFETLLKGAESIDIDFQEKSFEKNTAVVMALVGIWNRNFLKCSSHAVLCYNQYLDEFAAFLQQADMESNGKSTDRNGNIAEYETGPIIWGEPGTNGQHAFYQHLHQGTDCNSSDFIAFTKSNRGLGNHQNLLIANFFAQTQALAFGKTYNEVLAEIENTTENKSELVKAIPYKIFEGNRPTNTLIFKELNPFTLGQLVALYEHKIFVQGIIWNIFSFDQWGVEIGKVLANKILPLLENKENCSTFDSSSNGLINYYNQHK